MQLNEIKLEITNECLLSCAHCSTNSRSKNPTFLSLTTIENIIQQAHDLGSRNIVLSGGEPLLYPDIAKIIKIITKYGCHSTIYTSGITQILPISSVSLDYLMTFKSFGLSHLIFSLYSHESQRHDFITGVKGSFYATTSAIKNALLLGLETEVHVVALKTVIDALLPLVEFLEKLGIKQISVLRFVPQGRGEANSDHLLPNANDFVKLSRTLRHLLKRNTSTNCRIGSPFNFLMVKKPTPCNSGKTRMIIDSEGFAYPCDALKQFKINFSRNDNVYGSPLSEIIQNGKFFRLIQETALPAECESCVHVKKCLGGCLAQRCLTNVSGRDPACLFQANRISPLSKLTPHFQLRQGIL